jgi:twinkle protein
MSTARDELAEAIDVALVTDYEAFTDAARELSLNDTGRLADALIAAGWRKMPSAAELTDCIISVDDQRDTDVLVAALEASENAPIERIVRPEEMKDRVKRRGNGSHLENGVPFFLSDVNLAFRPHEITIWFGETKHGKTSLLNYQICYSASRGEKCLVASFEQPVDKTMLDMLIQYTGNPDIANSPDYDAAYDDMCSRILFYDSMARTKPEEIVATMKLAYKTLGVTQMVLDNAMTLDLDRGDNTGQAEAANLIRMLASQIPAHFHVVCHIRKPKDGSSKPPNLYDIMGVMEWPAMAYNIIAVWRDVAKSERISLMRDERMDPLEIERFYQSMPDGKILVRAQRETGELPIASYFYESTTHRAWKNPDDLVPLYIPPIDERYLTGDQE